MSSAYCRMSTFDSTPQEPAKVVKRQSVLRVNKGKRRKGICDTCGKKCALTRSGDVYKHVAQVDGTSMRKVCPGSATEPAMTFFE